MTTTKKVSLNEIASLENKLESYVGKMAMNDFVDKIPSFKPTQDNLKKYSSWLISIRMKVSECRNDTKRIGLILSLAAMNMKNDFC